MAEVSETTVSAIKALAWLGSTLGGGGASRRELSKQPLNAACLPSLCGAGASDSPPRIVAERGGREGRAAGQPTTRDLEQRAAPTASTRR